MIEPGIMRRALIFLGLLTVIALGTLGCYMLLKIWLVPGTDIFTAFLTVIFAGVGFCIGLFCLHIISRIVIGPIAWILYRDFDMSLRLFWAKIRGKA